MKDEYAMNIFTGELLPCTQAIKEFYKTHGALEAWTEEWKPTGQEADSFLSAPDFAGAVSV